MAGQRGLNVTGASPSQRNPLDGHRGRPGLARHLVYVLVHRELYPKPRQTAGALMVYLIGQRKRPLQVYLALQGAEYGGIAKLLLYKD